VRPKETNLIDIVLFLLKDIKFIGSGDEAKATMYYITDYITKSPLSMSAGLAALSYVIQKTTADSGEGCLPKTTTGAITTAVNSMLGHSEFSKPWVLYGLFGGKEAVTNESFVCVNWGEVSAFVRSVWLQEADEDQHSDAKGSNVVLPIVTTPLLSSHSHGNTEITASNTRLDYIHRPVEFEDFKLGLYNYFSLTSKSLMTANKEGVRTLGKSQFRFSCSLHLQYETHAVRYRRHPVIPVLLGPNLARAQSNDAEKESCARDALALFKPWRDPRDLKQPEETWVNTMSRFSGSLSAEDRQRLENMTLLAEGREARSTYRRD
jgi:hypothetical protein